MVCRLAICPGNRAGCDLHTSLSASKIVPHQSRASVSLQKIRIDLVTRALASASSRYYLLAIKTADHSVILLDPHIDAS
jgi:hypothetical protein